MIIKWESGISKDLADAGFLPSPHTSSTSNVIDITNPRFSRIDIKELKRLHTVHNADLDPDKSPDLPFADHRSNGFVNNPGLLHENEFYPLDPLNCWTHDPESDSHLAYCSIVLREQDDPLLYKIVKHGMNHIQKMYDYETRSEPSGMCITSDHKKYASGLDLVTNWSKELDNEEFFDLGDLTIIACGEITANNGQPPKTKDIENVEVYVCKLNLRYNEEHFIRLLQVEDILFSGLTWEFFAHDLRLGPYSSLDVINRFKRKTARVSFAYNLLWLDKVIFSDHLQLQNYVRDKRNKESCHLRRQENVDETLKRLDSMIQYEPPMQILQIGKDEEFYMSDSELSRIFGLNNSSKSSFSTDDLYFSRRVSHTDTEQTTPEKTFPVSDNLLDL
ncbi:unnamed protein product [Kluyveromyces dobzhanskii CBS 2104]|uniref:WGS project CCBQ000000000 data, contig 00058 n=1 Tax=Kluyveromyces dobzhanskii CBS 2104 TaxID=1427455 RepID=A0A0A8LDK3_9SACH|nr:unnamed protein product [Kluyveromyces dobzhanskii CBS 2104]